jgi:hypothetical protein
LIISTEKEKKTKMQRMMMGKIPKKAIKNSRSIENRVGRNEDIFGLPAKRELSSKQELEVSRVPISEKILINSSVYT